MNSRFTDHVGTGEVYDRLAMPEWQRWFVERCGLPAIAPPRPPVYLELMGLRALLRHLMTESGPSPDARDVSRLNEYLSRTTHWRELEARGARAEVRLGVRWSDSGWPAVIVSVALSYARLLEDNATGRVRKCANPDCSFIFLDTSRNVSRQWCDVTICGNLLKVRRHRLRTRALEA